MKLASIPQVITCIHNLFSEATHLRASGDTSQGTWAEIVHTKRSKARAAAQIGILPCLGEGEKRRFLFRTVIENGLPYPHCFSRDAQLQATVNTSCWPEFVLYIM